MYYILSVLPFTINKLFVYRKRQNARCLKKQCTVCICRFSETSNTVAYD